MMHSEPSHLLEYCLWQRRSIRKFTEEPVDRATVQELLVRAIQAPSASNLQPWRFVVIDDPQLVSKIKAFSPGLGGVPPCILLFCLDTALLPRQAETGLPDKSAAVLDLAMAAENLMLAAVDRGLGSCAVKSFHAKLIQRILTLPEALSPELMITLGVPAQTGKPPRRRELKDLVSYNFCGGEEHGAGR